MLTFIIRKMIKNKWLTICQLIGLTAAVALVTSIPVYTAGMLKRMLVKDLEALQNEKGIYPAAFTATNGFWGSGMENYNRLDACLKNSIIKKITVPLIVNTNILELDGFALKTGYGDEKKLPFIKGIKGIKENIQIAKGRIPQKTEGDIYEVMVSEAGYNNLGLSLEKEYRLKSIYSENDAVNIRVVGVFREKDTGNGFWLAKDLSAVESVIVDYDELKEKILPRIEKPYWRSTWFFSLNYHRLAPGEVSSILKAYEDGKRYLKALGHAGDYYFTGKQELENYRERKQRMNTTMWMLAVPVLMMAAMYVYMVSRIIVFNDENEIALIRSRGALRRQILANYLIESLAVSLIALASGIPLGLLLVQVIGSSNGFMEFIGRSAVPASLDEQAAINSVLVILGALFAMLIPAYKAAGKSIVEYKRQTTDIKKLNYAIGAVFASLLLGASIYILYRFNSYIKILSSTGSNSSDIDIDPAFFIVSSMFTMGSTLLVLIAYPFAIRSILVIGNKLWPPALHASLIYISRSGGRERLMVLFLVFSLSTGVLSANTARTLNRNMEDKVRYFNGADVTLMQMWPKHAKAVEQTASNLESMMLGMAKKAAMQNIKYEEPPFDVYRNLPGVQAAARVFVKDNGTIYLSNGSNVDGVQVIGMSPAEYGKVVWSRSDLLKYHINDYLNILIDSHKAVLLSLTFKKKYGIKEGDTIYFTWNGQEPVEALIYGFVDYWPRCNATQGPGGTMYFIVADIDYILSRMAKEPYEVWLRKKTGVSDTEINRQIENAGIYLERITYSDQEIIRYRNDPFLQGIYGLLTLNFIVVIIISAIDSLIYWIISIRNRILQFGLFRALGMHLREIIGMLFFEQLIIMGISVVSGIAIGSHGSALFIPLLRIMHGTVEQVPPFIVIASSSDYIKIYIALAALMVVQIVIIGWISAKICINSALKLGEE